MNAPLNRRANPRRVRSTAPRSSTPHGDEQWEKRAYISSLLGHPLLFVECPGLTNATAHTRLEFSREGLVRSNGLLSNSRIERVEIVEEAF